MKRNVGIGTHTCRCLHPFARCANPRSPIRTQREIFSERSCAHFRPMLRKQRSLSPALCEMFMRRSFEPRRTSAAMPSSVIPLQSEKSTFRSERIPPAPRCTSPPSPMSPQLWHERVTSLAQAGVLKPSVPPIQPRLALLSRGQSLILRSVSVAWQHPDSSRMLAVSNCEGRGTTGGRVTDGRWAIKTSAD